MKKTVKVLFSLVLVCLFAVQFAGAMPASASADRVDSKWDNVQLDTSVYVYGDDGAVKQDGDFGVKAGFSGEDQHSFELKRPAGSGSERGNGL